MRLEPNVHTHPRLLRKATLGEDSAAASKAPNKPEQPVAPTKTAKRMSPAKSAVHEIQPLAQPNPKPTSRGSRFVGATHLDEQQQVQIGRALKQKKIGDEMGRQIFIAAVEYQLSAFADQLMKSDCPIAAPPPRDRALEQILLAIEEQARVLSELLLQIPKPSKADLTKVLTAQDESGRNYDERYLCELGCEVDRLKRACGATVATALPKETAPDPNTSLGFVSKLAGIFAECFEQEPTAAADGPFRSCLEVLEEVTGFVIGHEPDFLARVMNHD